MKRVLSEGRGKWFLYGVVAKVVVGLQRGGARETCMQQAAGTRVEQTCSETACQHTLLAACKSHMWPRG